MEVFGLRISVGLEFIGLFMAPACLPHPLQAAQRVALVYREDNDIR